MPSLSVGLQEIIKLSQAGIAEGVILSYITNSTNVYNVSSDEIVYLNDLGISSTILTALIERDHAPETAARKRESTAITPLPPEVALKQPATNIYPATTPKSDMVQVPKYPEVESSGFTQTQVEPAPPPAPVTVYQPVATEPLPGQVSGYYASLAPYGTWYVVPEYGYCWQPTVSAINYHWRPYADHGRWLWTTHGWYWYSYYTWGWAPFHYGRWCSYPALGWIWVPDNVWGPSWVSWRHTRYHCGWAPLPPHSHYVSGFGLYYNHQSVGLHFDFGLSYHHYTFLPLNRFCEDRPYHYYASQGDAQTIYRDSQVVNNYIVGGNNTIINQGIGREPVARVSRAPIPVVEVRDDWQTLSPRERRERFVTENSEPVVLRPSLSSRSSEMGGRRGEPPSRDNMASPTGSTPAPRVENAGYTVPRSSGKIPPRAADNRSSRVEPAPPSISEPTVPPARVDSPRNSEATVPGPTRPSGMRSSTPNNGTTPNPPPASLSASRASGRNALSTAASSPRPTGVFMRSASTIGSAVPSDLVHSASSRPSSPRPVISSSGRTAPAGQISRPSGDTPPTPAAPSSLAPSETQRPADGRSVSRGRESDDRP